MSNVFNTVFEISLRVLLILATYGKLKTTDMICAIDFISVYGKEFGIAQTNLHGDNKYKYGEFSTRRTMVKKAIVFLIQRKMIEIFQRNDGYDFYITDAGKAYCNLFTSDYAIDYTKATKAASVYIGDKSESEIIRDILSHSMVDLRRI